MLKYVMSYYDELVSFMNNVNENVKWNEVMNKLIGLPIDKLLTKLKVYVWSDKDLMTSEYDPVNRNTYLYYMKWYYKLFEKFDESGVVIIDEPMNEEIINDLINNKMKQKTDALKNMLSFYGKEYMILNDGNVEKVKEYMNKHKNNLLFPTCSISYNKPEELISQLPKKYELINDGYYNLYSTPQELEFNILRLFIVELINDPSIDVETLMKNKYGMMKIESLVEQ